MSPFADQPEMWLTGHLERQKQHEVATKIQAAVKGHLYRRKLQRQSTDDFIVVLMDKLKPPKTPLTVQEFLKEKGLGGWADECPPVRDALLSIEANKQREECLWHAKNSLRLMGKGMYVADLEWCDYHERTRAMHALCDVGSPVESLWEKFKKLFTA